MRTIWGPVTEIRDLGVVAERCPYCEQVEPCLLRSVCRGHYVCFVKTTAPTSESSCLCTGCHKAFPCEGWRYATLLPIQEAKTVPVQELLARTNPGLAERLQLNAQIGALGGDACFATAYEQVGGMRAGAMCSGFLGQLLNWERLSAEQRTLLGQEIGARARAWQFARHIAPGFPSSAGCLPAALAGLAVCSAFVWAPALRNLLAGSLTLVVALGAAALTRHLLQTRRVTQWTRNVLIPEADDAGVSLPSFLAVVDDLSGSRLEMMEELWPIKLEIETIRAVLTVQGKH